MIFREILVGLCLLFASTRLSSHVHCASLDILKRANDAHKVMNQWAVTAGSRRALLANSSPQCVWTGSCALNADFVTSLSGTPTTESQKYLALEAARNNLCSSYDDSSTCTANTTNMCDWNYLSDSCGLADRAMLNNYWLRGIVYCPGSYMDTALTCGSLTTQSSCGANSNCLWQPISIARKLSSMPFTGTAGTFNASGVCYSKLVNTVTGNTWTALAGNCSTNSNFVKMNTSCTSSETAGGCIAIPGCEWTSDTVGCSLASNFYEFLVLNATDPWVKAYRTAASQCAAISNETACGSYANFTANTAVYNNYLQLNPSFPIYSSGAVHGVSGMSMLLGLLVALMSFWGLLM